jgi:hypothetical protein
MKDRKSKRKVKPAPKPAPEEALGWLTHEVIARIRNPKLLKRALYWEWITPMVQGGLGRRSLFDIPDVLALWERFKRGEFPPLLPCEQLEYDERQREIEARKRAKKGERE